MIELRYLIVYAFSDSYGRLPSYSRVESDDNVVTQDTNKKSDLNVSGFRLLEMFSDKMKKTEQSDACLLYTSPSPRDG